MMGRDGRYDFADSLGRALEEFEREARALDAVIHEEAVNALAHTEQHRDPTPIRQLLEAVTGPQRQLALQSWFERHGPIVWNGEGVLKIIPRQNKRYRPFAVEEARALSPFAP